MHDNLFNYVNTLNTKADDTTVPVHKNVLEFVLIYAFKYANKFNPNFEMKVGTFIFWTKNTRANLEVSGHVQYRNKKLSYFVNDTQVE